MKSEHGYRASPESKARRATRSCPDCRSPMLLPPCLLCRLPSPLPTLPLCEPRRSTHYLRTRSQSHLSPHHNSVPQMERNCTNSENEEIKKPRFQEAKIVEVRGTPHRRSGGLGFTPPLGPGHLGVANVYCVQFTFVTVILIPVTEMGRCRTAHAAPGQAESPCAGPRTNPRPREPKKGRSRGTRKESPPTQSTTHSKSKSTERDTTRPARGRSLHIC